MLREEVDAGGEFLLSGTAGENLLVSGGNESDFVRGRIRRKFPGKLPGKGAAVVIGEFAVGEREGLLGNDGLAAAIALGGVRRVEQLGELALAVGLGEALEIETAVTGFLRVGIRQRIANGCQVEFIGEEEDAIAQDFGFHLARVHAPEVAVFGVALVIRSSRRKEALSHPGF